MSDSQISKEVVQRFLSKQGCWSTLSEFLTVPQILQLNLVNRQFYEEVVPHFMRNRNLNPSITPETHIFAKGGTIYQLHFNNQVPTREVDFEEDEWRHDNQHKILDANVKPQPLIKVSDLVDHPDQDIKINNDEEILSQYIVQINRYKFLVWPLKGALKLCRGVFIDIDREGKVTYKRTSEPPGTILKPGISVQRRDGVITDILFLGGNQEKKCHYYNMATDEWRTAGVLPTYHLVT